MKSWVFPSKGGFPQQNHGVFFLLNMIILECEMGVPLFSETPIYHDIQWWTKHLLHWGACQRACPAIINHATMSSENERNPFFTNKRTWWWNQPNKIQLSSICFFHAKIKNTCDALKVILWNVRFPREPSQACSNDQWLWRGGWARCIHPAPDGRGGPQHVLQKPVEIPLFQWRNKLVNHLLWENNLVMKCYWVIYHCLVMKCYWVIMIIDLIDLYNAICSIFKLNDDLSQRT